MTVPNCVPSASTGYIPDWMKSSKYFATHSHPFPGGNILGLKVAVQSFFRELITSAPFEKLLFFTQTHQPLELLLDQAQQHLKLTRDDAGRIEFRSMREYPELLKAGKIGLLYAADPRIAGLMSLRNQCDISGMTLTTGVTHSLNSTEDPINLQQVLLHNPTCKDAIVCTSSDAKKVLERNFDFLRESFPVLKGMNNPELPVIPLGVNLPGEGQTKEEARTKISAPQKDILILYVGRIHSMVKADLRPVFKVLKRLRMKANVRFICAGALPDNDKLEKEALLREAQVQNCSSAFTLIPNPTDKLKDTLYRAADIFLSPVDNFQETFGLSILEAMSYGRPVVCSDWGGYRDLVVHGETGFLTPTQSSFLPDHDKSLAPGLGYQPIELPACVGLDDAELTAQLQELVLNDTLRNSMGEKGKQRAMEFTWKKVVFRYLELWEEMEARKPERVSVEGYHFSQPQVFSSYPSKMLSPDTAVQLHEVQGNSVNLPPPHPVLNSLMKEQDFATVLNLIAGRGGKAMISELQSAAPNAPMAVAYLIKHGLLIPVCV